MTVSLVLAERDHVFTPSPAIGLLLFIVGAVLWLFGDRILDAFKPSNCGNCGRCLRCTRRVIR